MRFRGGTLNVGSSVTVPNWQARADRSIGVIKGTLYAPTAPDGQRKWDLGALQEVEADQFAYFREKLPGYDFWPRTWVGQGDKFAGANPVFWRRDRFDLLHGHVDYPAPMQDSLEVRSEGQGCVYLRHKSTGGDVLLLSVHDPAKSSLARMRYDLARYYRVIATGEDVATVCIFGDFNSGYRLMDNPATYENDPANLAHVVITRDSPMRDAYLTSRNVSPGITVTTSENYIDHLFVSANMRPTAFYKTPAGPTANGSDIHPALFADFEES